MGAMSETPFRVYSAATAPGGGTGIVTWLGASDDLSLAELLQDMHRQGRLDGVRVGIMYRPVDGQPGEWLVNPWA